MEKLSKRYFGDRAFYKGVMTIAIPMIVQNLITNFVNMLDNIMVGQMGTAPMSGVSIVNQLLFVVNLCIFGASAGAGIFTAQFYGSGKTKSVQYTFRFKLIILTIISALGIVVMITLHEPLIGLYLKGEGAAGTAESFMKFGKEYLYVMVVGLVPFALANAYSSTLRETGNTTVPMIAGISAVIVNLVFNYILIFGHFGAPAMGVRGAALATVISRFVELGIVVIWSHTHTVSLPYVKGLYKGFGIPEELTKSIAVRGLPLMMNELAWSIGMTILNQCYSSRSLDVVSAVNISSTIWGLFSVFFMTIGNVVGIIMGQHLGAGDKREDVIDLNRKLSVFSVLFCLIFAVLLASVSGLFPKIYNTSDSVRSLAQAFIITGAIMMPFNSYTNACYFTMRSGGKTLVTFIFDCGFAWVICVPLAWCLTNLTALPIIPLYFIVNSVDIVKCLVGFLIVRSGSWIQNLSAQD